MNLMAQNLRVSQYEQAAYELRGIVYVPHYRNNAIFVGPGYPRHNVTRYSAEELMLMGAVPRVEFLWSRGTSGRVDARNP
jgi:hypothetical protein|tara:strand:- start:847 stop:1086 length:240 start_codon:yes stop_codon:yes gene_type:complete